MYTSVLAGKVSGKKKKKSQVTAGTHTKISNLFTLNNIYVFNKAVCKAVQVEMMKEEMND